MKKELKYFMVVFWWGAGFYFFSKIFYYIISTKYQKIGDLFYPVQISGLLHSLKGKPITDGNVPYFTPPTEFREK